MLLPWCPCDIVRSNTRLIWRGGKLPAINRMLRHGMLRLLIRISAGQMHMPRPALAGNEAFHNCNRRQEYAIDPHPRPEQRPTPFRLPVPALVLFPFETVSPPSSFVHSHPARILPLARYRPAPPVQNPRVLVPPHFRHPQTRYRLFGGCALVRESKSRKRRRRGELSRLERLSLRYTMLIRETQDEQTIL